MDLATVLCLVGAAYLFWSSQRQGGRATANRGFKGLAPGTQVAPLAISVRGPTGGLVTDTLEGPALIYVYKSNCPACAMQKPEWLDLVQSATAHQLRVVAISPEGVDSATEAYWGHSGITVAGAGPSGAALAQFEIQVVPTTILLDADRKVALFHPGVMTETDLSELRAHLSAGDGTR